MQIDKCFGFDTAVEEAQRALLAAKVEASSACNGVGLVRLMGRQSGYIAMQASMASGALGTLEACHKGVPVGCSCRAAAPAPQWSASTHIVLGYTNPFSHYV